MPEFQTMFVQSKGRPIVYAGKTLVMSDFVPTEGATKFRLVLELCNSNRRQGVLLRLVFKDSKGKWQKGAASGKDGRFIVNGEASSGKDGIAFWNSTSPMTWEFEVSGEAAVINLFNVWESEDHRGKRFVDSKHNGAAMIVEEIPNGRRYRCNDGEPDDDFDDIVFRLERVQ